METQEIYSTSKGDASVRLTHAWQSPEVRVQRVHPDAMLPQYAHPGDSGMDVYAIEDVTIPPGESRLIHIGLKIAVPEGSEAQIRPKSGIALKRSVTVLNTPGTIDGNYRGEVCVLLINHGRTPYLVKKHHKIAQLVICPVLRVEIRQVETLDATERGAGGFGSTGLTTHVR